MICAAEDVGNADPHGAECRGTAAAQAVERIGMPEAQIILSQAVDLYGTARRKAMQRSMRSAKRWKSVKDDQDTMPVPVHLQDAHYKGAGKLGTWNRLQICT